MPITIPALITPSAGKPFERGTIERRDVGPNDVLIDIAYAGICHSDIHQAREEWGAAIFPMVPGHEIAGIVREVGADVTKHAVGDRVGVGCFVDSCRECENCLAGEEQFCAATAGRHLQRPRSTTATDRPTAATARRSSPTRSTSCASPTASRSTPPPRCCAPASRRTRRCATGVRAQASGSRSSAWAASATWRVKIAHALGAHVTVLSPTLSKEAEGRALGADEYYATEDAGALQARCATLRPDHQHRLRRHPRRQLPGDAPPRTARWSSSACPRSRSSSACSRSPAAAARSPDRTSAASARPRRCSTSAPSTASRRHRDHCGRRGQRRVRARGRGRRPLPLRHRHGDDSRGVAVGERMPRPGADAVATRGARA